MTQTATLTSSDAAEEDQFAYTVAVSGDTVIVGAAVANGGGEAYVFEEPPNGWVDMTETAKLTASDEGREDGFGNAVAIDRGIVAIGSSFNNLTGAVYVYLKPKSGWKTTSRYNAKLTGNDGSYEEFGKSVAISGHAVVVGSPFETIDGYIGQGTAYVFYPQ
jgi:hypothetical protein